MIDNLPTLSGQFECAFSALGKMLTTDATRTANGVSCTTPRTDHIPPNQNGQRTYLLACYPATTFILICYHIDNFLYTQ